MASPTISSSNSDRKAEIDRCLGLIAPSASDESKFVGMLMLPRLLNQDDHASIQHVFDHMNFKFIERLLRTNHQVGGEVPDHVLKEIAVNVLACFAHYDAMAPTQNMIDRIPALSTVLTPNDKTDVTKEALHILTNVSTTKEGLVRILDPDVLKNIMEVFAGTKNDEERQLCFQLLTCIYARSFHLQETTKPIPSLNSALKYSLQTSTLPIAASLFNHTQDKLKMDALGLLYHILMTGSTEWWMQLQKDWTTKDKYVENMRMGLLQVLGSKLGDQIRDQALVVLACLLRTFGPDWLFSWLKQTKKAKASKTDQLYRNAHLPVLVIHLVSVESRVMLDIVQDHWVALHDGRLAEVDEAKEARHTMMIPVYFEILESAIEYLASQFDQDKDSGMDAEMLLKIRKALTEVMDVVMEMLKFMQDTADNEQELETNLIAQASMRIIALWLAEEGFEM
ncbi:Neurochondrin-domain-containing protein [Chlamydoabsidia padenii]|nr:Neurochondrin-domain-containing protein [Chlamydoabsidia padenii]